MLYQVWYTGALSAVYWMSDARLLILCGDNAGGYWEKRGHPGIKATFPYVIFAIRPTLGFIVAKHLRTDGDSSEEEPGPVWCRCVLPPEASDVIRPRTLTAPFGKHSPGRYVNFGLQYKSNHDAGVELLVDENGNLVPGAITKSDAYNRDRTLRRIEEIHLGDLPPIVRKPLGAEDVGRP